MEKKLTNSGPLKEPADKHSIYVIKLFKRQMYGRAKLDLLRQRVLYAA